MPPGLSIRFHNCHTETWLFSRPYKPVAGSTTLGPSGKTGVRVTEVVTNKRRPGGSVEEMQQPQELELWRYLRSQRELAARLIEGESLEQVAPRFLEIVADLLRWEAGAIWEVVGSSEPLRLVSGWSTPDLDAKPLWRRSRELS